MPILFIQNDTEATIAIGATIVIVLGFNLVIIFVAFFYQKRRQQHKQKMLEVEKYYSEELLKTRLEIQEETFKNISQEMHDNIGQSLIFAKLNVSTIDITNPGVATQKLLDTKDQLAKTIQDVRDLAKSLDPDFFSKKGLSGSIAQQLQFMQRTGEYETGFTITGDEQKYPQQKELIVFRIVQELLNNIVKHAEARLVSVTMHYANNHLTVTVTDDGKGFDKEKAIAANAGLGLANMHSRMAMVGGSFIINSTPGNGATAVIKLPV